MARTAIREREKLALHGGSKAKAVPYGTGKRFGEDEKRELAEVIDAGTLFYTSGTKVKELCRRFAEKLGVKHAVATSSGTASLHVALGAVGIGPGDEVLTTPITDMGTVIGILYQNAVPVFADLDGRTYNPDPASVALAQLKKLDKIIARRRALGDRLTELLKGAPGLLPPLVAPGGRSSYWFYMFRLDSEALSCSRDEFVQALVAEGLPASGGYIAECIYLYEVFQKQSAYPHSRCPFDCPKYGRKVDYPAGLCPTAEEILRSAVRLPISEFFTEHDIEETARALRKVAGHYSKE